MIIEDSIKGVKMRGKLGKIYLFIWLLSCGSIRDVLIVGLFMLIKYYLWC